MNDTNQQGLHTSLSPSGASFHYGWVIVGVGFLTIFACVGLARYAYTMLIPSMQSGLQLNYDKMGFIGTANFCGYLLSVVFAPSLIKRFKPRLVIAGGLIIITVSLYGMSVSHGFMLPLLLYFMVGIGSGFANIPTFTLISYWFCSDKRGKAAGIVVGGMGAAIVLAGVLVPFLNKSFGVDGWRVGWQMLSAFCLVIMLIAAWLVRNQPSDIGLKPFGQLPVIAYEQLIPQERKGDGRILVHLGLLYMAFGATFMVYGTFVVTTLVKEYGLTEYSAGMYWSWIGFFSLFSGLVFGGLSDNLGRKYGLALAFTVQTCAYLLAGLKLNSAGMVLSAVLFGSAVFSIPAIMAASVGEYLGVHRAASSFATVTIFFAAGQTVGPSIAGMIGKATGSFAGAYLLASLITALAVLFSLFLPRPAVHVEKLL